MSLRNENVRRVVFLFLFLFFVYLFVLFVLIESHDSRIRTKAGVSEEDLPHLVRENLPERRLNCVRR